jgi:hypothetical protein
MTSRVTRGSVSCLACVVLAFAVAACGDSFTDGGAPDAAAGDPDARDDDRDGGSVDRPDVSSFGADASANDAERDASREADATPPDDASDAADASSAIDAALDGGDASICNDTVDESAGIFVSPGSATSACGSRTAPCGSVQAAIDLAAATGKSIVYLDHGSYNESVALKPGITIQGGWNDIGGTWKRQCTGDPSGIAVIKAAAGSNVTVSALDFANGAAPAKLDTLTISSKASANAGESLYGVFTRGAATSLALSNVAVTVADGGRGADGAIGGVGATGANGCTTPSDAATPAAGGNGAAAPACALTKDGFIATTGGDASQGNTGHNGTAGSPAGCISAANCYWAGDGQTGCTGYPTGRPESCGNAGTVGCGGEGGVGGHGGGAGGSSIALFAWGASISVDGGLLTAGSGGRGGDGGPGGSGGKGGTGGAGAPASKTVPTNCKTRQMTGPNGDPYGVCDILKEESGSPGGAGSQGGSGSSGGIGGGGAGGFSYAYVKGSGAMVNVSAGTALHHGAAGAGGTAPNAGPSGVAANSN